jgi:hypothetical protein
MTAPAIQSSVADTQRRRPSWPDLSTSRYRLTNPPLSTNRPHPQLLGCARAPTIGRSRILPLPARNLRCRNPYGEGVAPSNADADQLCQQDPIFSNFSPVGSFRQSKFWTVGSRLSMVVRGTVLTRGMGTLEIERRLRIGRVVQNLESQTSDSGRSDASQNPSAVAFAGCW